MDASIGKPSGFPGATPHNLAGALAESQYRKVQEILEEALSIPGISA